MTQMSEVSQYPDRPSNTHANPRDEHDKGIMVDAQAYIPITETLRSLIRIPSDL